MSYLPKRYMRKLFLKETDCFSSAHLIPGRKMQKESIFLAKKKKGKKKEMKISDGFAIGFCKFLGGALLCIIPHPVTWGIGAGLAAAGAGDMLEHANDPDGITMEELDKQLREREERIRRENASYSWKKRTQPRFLPLISA